MILYLTRRIGRGLLLLAGVSVLCFVLSELAPGDFFIEARLNPQIPETTLAAHRSQHALDRPLLAKYAYWLGSVVRGEWGFSFSYNTYAAPLLWTRARNTLVLTITATSIAWIVAVPVAIWIASSGSGVLRLLIAGAVSLLLALPDVLVVLLLMVAAARTQLLPVGGMESPEYSDMGLWNKIQDAAAHLALPVTALVLPSLPLLIAHTRSAMAEVLGSPFIRAARANGIPLMRILYRHALPAAANPLISLLGFSVGTLLSSSLLVEAAIGWPGLGRLLLDAILQRDVYVVIGAVMLSAVLLIGGNLLADMLLYIADPRIRKE
jgi:peptide/nickel transport system permease protein